MLNFILWQLFSYSTIDIILQNGIFSLSKQFWIAMSFYYNYLCNLLSKNFKNNQLNTFFTNIFVIFGIYLVLYLYSFFAVAFKTIYTLTSNYYIHKHNKWDCIVTNDLILKYDIFKKEYSILNELLKSKNYLFSI